MIQMNLRPLPHGYLILFIANILAAGCAGGHPARSLITVINDKTLSSVEKTECMEAVLEDGVDVNANDGLGNTSLMYAVKQGDIIAVDFLIRNGADVNAINLRGECPISLAVAKSDWILVEVLKERGAHIDTRNNRGETLLYVAAEAGDREAVERLIHMGATLDVKGKTTLAAAASSGDLSLVQYIVEKHNANVDPVEGALSPLSVAAGKGHLEVVKYLIHQSANVNCGEGAPLWMACGSGNLEVVKFLVAHGVDVEADTPDRDPPAYHAIANGHEAVAAYLFSVGAAFPRFDSDKDMYATASINRVFAEHCMGKEDMAGALGHLRVAEEYYEKAFSQFNDIAEGYSWAKKKQSIIKFVAIGLHDALQQANARQQSREFAQMAALKTASESQTGVDGYFSAYNMYMESLSKTTYTRDHSTLWSNRVSVEAMPLDLKIEYFKSLALESHRASVACRVIAKCIRSVKSNENLEECIKRSSKTE